MNQSRVYILKSYRFKLSQNVPTEIVHAQTTIVWLCRVSMINRFSQE